MAYEGDVVTLHQVKHTLPYSREEMNALMAVDVGDGKSGIGGLLKLGFDLSMGHRWRNGAQDEAYQNIPVPQSKCSTGGEMAMHGCIIGRGPPYRQREMDAYVQLGVLPGQLNRLLKRPPRDHDARSGDNSLSAGLDDSLVDPMGHPEIIGIDDEPFHGEKSYIIVSVNMTNAGYFLSILYYCTDFANIFDKVCMDLARTQEGCLHFNLGQRNS